jgi:hypothetical protein
MCSKGLFVLRGNCCVELTEAKPVRNGLSAGSIPAQDFFNAYMAALIGIAPHKGLARK